MKVIKIKIKPGESTNIQVRYILSQKYQDDNAFGQPVIWSWSYSAPSARMGRMTRSSMAKNGVSSAK